MISDSLRMNAKEVTHEPRVGVPDYFYRTSKERSHATTIIPRHNQAKKILYDSIRLWKFMYESIQERRRFCMNLYKDSSVIGSLLLLLKLIDQKLTLLPVRRLTVIMTNETNIKRKRTALFHVPLLQQLHQSRPPKISWSLYQIFSLKKIES